MNKQQLEACVKELEQLLHDMDSLYVRAWDTTEGSLVFFPESVQMWSEMHARNRIALGCALFGDRPEDWEELE